MNQNVDPQEIARFAAQAHSWWDPSASMQPLHAMNPVRLSWIQECLPLAGKHVVDVGCGGGLLSESLAKQGAASVLGIDLAEKSLRVAGLHALEQGLTNVRYECISAEELALREPERFDLVTCMEMLEHVPNPQSVVTACARLLKPGGWAIFSTLNRNARSFGLAIVAAEYLLNILPKGTHEYAKCIRPSELAAFVEQAQLEVRAIQGMRYNPITKRCSLHDDTSIHYMLAGYRPLV